MSKHNSDTIYEYKKVKTIDNWNEYQKMAESYESLDRDKILKNKINELAIEQNHLMKDFELYKKAFKQFVREMREKWYSQHLDQITNVVNAGKL